MRILIANSSPDPIYEQILRQIKAQIIAGDLREGEPLPSIRRLAQDLQISVITTNLFRVVGPKKTILSGCGGSTSYIDSEKLPNIRSDFSVGSGCIADLIKQTLTSELHQLTGGIHVVALAGAEVPETPDIVRFGVLAVPQTPATGVFDGQHGILHPGGLGRVGPLAAMDIVNRTRSLLTQNNIPATLVKELPTQQETP